jgi:hypothetical protein
MPNSRMMIHNAMGLCFGQAVDMREYAAFLEDSSRNIAEIYADRSGTSTDEWCTLMDSVGLIGQWYSAQEAVDAKLADSVWESTKTGAEPDDKAPAAKAAEPESADDSAKIAALKARNLAARNRLAAQRHGISA